MMTREWGWRKCQLLSMKLFTGGEVSMTWHGTVPSILPTTRLEIFTGYAPATELHGSFSLRFNGPLSTGDNLIEVLPGADNCSTNDNTHTKAKPKKSKIKIQTCPRRSHILTASFLRIYRASSNSDVPLSIPHRMHEDRVPHCFQSRLLRCHLEPISHSLAQIREFCRRSLGDLVLFQPILGKPLEIDNMLLLHLWILLRVGRGLLARTSWGRWWRRCARGRGGCGGGDGNAGYKHRGCGA